MPSLSRELRAFLERTIAGTDGARSVAEVGAAESLRRLAVDRVQPHSALSSEDRSLRNELWAHARQLGDKQDPQSGNRSISHLTQAVAYEHWHRLLFARFLAENDLLLHPEHGVALTLSEVKEVALGTGRDWIELAAEFAQRMLLREVFRSDDPALRVPLSPEKRRDLEDRLNSLPRDIFLADDSLGWVYQFWQKDAKGEVNRSEVRIGADELSPVTQLFTEDYMVLFLLENTIGAWWTARRGSSNLPGYTWTYLRLNKDGAPAAGAFDRWPKAARDLTILDPCMGSGHFLIFALPIVARMRAEEEGLPLPAAIVAVLRDNLFGLELDPRCSQIAAFNLALTAWKMVGHHFELPVLNVACSGLPITAKEEDWVKLAGDDGLAEEGMRRLYPLFKDAPVLGSLIDPMRYRADLYSANIDRLVPLLERAFTKESSNDEVRELVVAAQGVLAAFRILSHKFTLVVTNVPYLLKSKQCEELQAYCRKYAPDATADLATVFLERCAMFCTSGGSHATVSPQNWLFLKSYTKFRRRMLTTQQIHHVASVGSGATATASWDVLRALVISSVTWNGDDYDVTGISTDAPKEAQRASDLRFGETMATKASVILESPGSRIAFGSVSGQTLLREYAKSHLGICTGDYPQFGRVFWELNRVGEDWAWQQSSIKATALCGGLSSILFWQKGRGSLYNHLCERLGPDGVYAWLRGEDAWGHQGVLMTATRQLPATRYFGHLFDNNVTVLTVEDETLLPAIWAFCESGALSREVRRFNQKLSITDQSFVEAPFELATWQKVAADKYPHGLPKPHSCDPTQWIFSGCPKDSDVPLQVAVCRLVGYAWPRQAGSSFPGSPQIEPDDLETYVAADGIACLSSVAGEENAGTRLRSLLQSAYGNDYNLMQLLVGKKSTTIEGWLRDEFFEEHCKVFLQVPFVWHVWDGLKDGFHALLNYHKLDRKNLEKLTFSYLGDWLTRQRQDVHNGVEGADARLAAAEHLQGELKKILEGEQPYDVFVRWKPISKQQIGWEPDLNDGVRMNIRPWITEAKLHKAVKPGICRITPSITYTKDRGKEPLRDPIEFPWFSKLTDRINDHHLSLDEKRRARGKS